MPKSRVRQIAGGVAVTTLGCVLLAAGAFAVWPATKAQATARKPETLGFVITKFWHSMAEEPDCPDGMNQTMAEVILDQSTPDERARYSTPEGQKELVNRAMYIADKRFICQNPTAVKVRPLKLVKGSQKVPGLNLDGEGTLTKARGSSCAHENFSDAAGKVLIDNQLFRIGGCIKGRRFGGIAHQSATAEMINGSYSIIFEISGVDDRQNDPDVEVGVYASLDPTPFSAAAKPLPNGSLQPHPDKQYWTKTRGKIVAGVLTTEPTDIALPLHLAGMKNESLLRQARFELTLKPDGSAEGVLAGYYEVMAYYQNQVAYNGYRHFADGAALTSGFNCPSIYIALQEQADGLRNPKTGACEGISTAMIVEAQPAFVIKP